ncbi:multiple sugar transport system permease protein/putative aldouronate transport system permease protein [Paenibacillus taihuensis]|uniref:Multiple sugar transport system permease protein/putative aldouronate transport system permease protein n=1 Tax=Paenibacillus taihuensis TaxID=1156355 RepID=A0A3D9QBU7_9BACL|nr:carbohydrate ABC transporter permease [Paenibacillus taihuensis]REE57427.1 multiple sugar transport system permease protein/putative aldouronate transport system permease protein [Paenibacillus taihuensis]
MVRNTTPGAKAAEAVLVILLALISFSSLFPIIHNLAISFSMPAKAMAGFVTVFPKGFTIESYKKLYEDSVFFSSFWVSVKRVVVTCAISFFISLLMSYPLSRSVREFKLRNVYMWLLVFSMMFNGGLIPFYLVVRQMHLMNNFWVLVLPMLVNVFNVILIVNYFRSIPKELDESAAMDGAGPWYKAFRIYMPLSMPVLATTTLFLIVTVWNEFMLGLIFINHESGIPLQTYMQQLVVRIDPTLMQSLEDVKRLASVSDKTLGAAKIFASMLPIMLVYPFLQRFFISGIMLGSVKE